MHFHTGVYNVCSLFSSGVFNLASTTLGMSGNTIRSVFEPCVVLGEYFCIVAECLCTRMILVTLGRSFPIFLALKRYINNVASYLANIADIIMFSSRHTQMDTSVIWYSTLDKKMLAFLPLLFDCLLLLNLYIESLYHSSHCLSSLFPA